MALATKEARKALQIRFNHVVLRLFCAALLPPSLLGYNEWDEMIQLANPKLSSVSISTMAQVQIPRESAYVLRASLDKLKKLRNLTISYDGGTTRAPQSIYTVHVTTPDKREAHLIAGDEASGVSHTGVHLKTLLLRVSFLLPIFFHATSKTFFR